MKRMQPPPFNDWRAVRDPRGQWTLMDATGSNPLRSPDPVTRLYAVHQAAAAPRQGAALLWLLQDLWMNDQSFHLRHRVRMSFAEGALTAGRPLMADLARALRAPATELDLSDLEEAA